MKTKFTYQISNDRVFLANEGATVIDITRPPVADFDEFCRKFARLQGICKLFGAKYSAIVDASITKSNVEEESEKIQKLFNLLKVNIISIVLPTADMDEVEADDEDPKLLKAMQISNILLKTYIDFEEYSRFMKISRQVDDWLAKVDKITEGTEVFIRC